MLRGVFITGTDTKVGKTIVAAALMHRFRAAGGVRYWKPIQTGIEQDDDTATVGRIGSCREDELFRQGVRLPRPVSPHLAAKWDGTRLSISGLIQRIPPDSGAHRWIVEGAGGVLVPISESEMMIDLMICLSMPVLVVARSALGTINHTLMTLETLRRRDLQIAGVVMVGERNSDNREAITRYGGVDVLGEMPLFPSLTPEIVGDWAKTELDTANRLLQANGGGLV